MYFTLTAQHKIKFTWTNPKANKREILTWSLTDLNFKAHVGFVTISAFYHLNNIAKVQPFLFLSDTETHCYTEQAGLL